MATKKSGGAALLGIAFLAAIVTVDDDGDMAFQRMTQDNVTFTVDHKERVNSDDNSRFMIWTTKADGLKEVFEDTDTKAFWKFNSADVYGDLKEGQTYDAHVTGWRMPFFSANRNIISVTPK